MPGRHETTVSVLRDTAGVTTTAPIRRPHTPGGTDSVGAATCSSSITTTATTTSSPRYRFKADVSADRVLHTSGGAAPATVDEEDADFKAYIGKSCVPRLFNDLGEALLQNEPDDPVAFMAAWLHRKRKELKEEE